MRYADMVVTGRDNDESAEQFASAVLDEACDPDGMLGYEALTVRLMPRSVRDGLTEMVELVGLLAEVTDQGDRGCDALDRLASCQCETRESWGLWLLTAGVLIGARFGGAPVMPERELLGALADAAELVDGRNALERLVSSANGS